VPSDTVFKIDDERGKTWRRLSFCLNARFDLYLLAAVITIISKCCGICVTPFGVGPGFLQALIP